MNYGLEKDETSNGGFNSLPLLNRAIDASNLAISAQGLVVSTTTSGAGGVEVY